jgi:hypothetical protein
MATSCSSSTPKTTEEDNDDSFSRVLELPDGERISYVCLPPPPSSRCGTAVLHFYPLSGCAATSLAWAPFWKSLATTPACCLITVDRPGCHLTSPIVSADDATDDDDWVGERLRVHTRNVLKVLQHEQIHTVYILAVCLGHAYAVDVARALLEEPPTYRPRIEVKALSLVAPFCSTACPATWYLARLGRAVPSWLLYGATESMMRLGSLCMPYFLTPSAVRSLLNETEQEAWRDPEDYKQVCRLIQEVAAPQTRAIKATEARLGASSAWQAAVDALAQRAGYGVQIDGHTVPAPHQPEHESASYAFPPVRIHSSPHDKMVTPAAAQWLATRCYADCELVSHPEISSHFGMTMLGGPPRNPRLLGEIVRNEFGLCG